jgi:TolB-like protein/Tfp pilus assembly protein PilF
MPTGMAPQTYRFGKFTLDLHKGVLLRAGERVFLRPKAYALLLHLARDMGRVIPKSELMDAVWPNVTVTEDSLTQCVSEIRKALGDDGQDLVRTITGRGYLLEGGSEVEGAFENQPSVAVLRFRNESNEPDQIPIVDGFTEDILNGLARFRTVTVMARNSSFAFSPDTSLDWPSIGKRLGADYLIEGAIRYSADRIVIAVGLIEAAGAIRLWGERFEAKTAEIFKIQDEIAHRVVSRLVALLEDAGRNRAARKAGSNLIAYELLLRGVALLRGYRRGDNEDARALFEAAIAKDPTYGLAHAYLALSRVIIGGYAFASDVVLADALDLAVKGVTLAPEEPKCHRILALVRLYLRQYEPAEHHLRRSLELNPYDADTVAQMGYLLTMRGRPLDGLAWMNRAVRLNPIHPDWYHWDRATALYSVGEYRAAAAALERLPLLAPLGRVRLAACYAQVGELNAARRHMAKATETASGYALEDLVRIGAAFEHPADVQHLIEGIRIVLEP